MDDIDTKSNMDFSLLLTNTSDLMGKKSVRVTLKLSAEFIEAVTVLSAQLGIKQKSLLDHLMEDMDSLQAIASRMERSGRNQKDRIQKTFVISKKSLLSLETVSKKFSASRDDIVEYSIKRLFPILAMERQRQKKREEVLAKIAVHLIQTTELLDEVKQLVGKDDLLYTALKDVVASYEITFNTIDDFVVKGKRMTAFPMEKLHEEF
jgi:predicted transcriptional regulator